MSREPQKKMQAKDPVSDDFAITLVDIILIVVKNLKYIILFFNTNPYSNTDISVQIYCSNLSIYPQNFISW